MVFSIASVIPAIAPIKIVDIGAMDLGEEPPYARLKRATAHEIIGFEPVDAERAKLQSSAPDNHTYLPHIIGDGSNQTFHECEWPMTSSVFEPDTTLVERFQSLGEFMGVVKRTPVTTTRLDDVPEVAGTDFLKLDIQGAELMAFQGGVEMLKGVSVIHTEVSFVPMYRGQPLFGEIDVFLRSQGFFFLRFIGVAGRTYKPFLYKNDKGSFMSQVLWGDALFVRSFMTFEQQQPATLLKLATILHENYGSFDLAAVALDAYDKLMGTGLNGAYVAAFSKAS